MRIGFLTTEYPLGNKVTKGGLGSYLRRITLALAARGHEPHVFHYANRMPGVQIENGIHIHTIESCPSKLISKINILTRNRLKQTLASFERAYRFRRYINEFMETQQLDIIQTPNSMVPGLLISGEVPLVVRCSSYRPIWDKYDGIRRNLDRRIYTQLEALQYRQAAGVFAPTKLLADILQKELGLAEVDVIRTPFYNEVSEQNNTLYEKELAGKDYLLFFGRLSPQKGAQILAKALPFVWQRHPDLVAVFIGKDWKLNKNSTMTEIIRKVCAKYEDNLLLLPPLTHRLLYPIIAQARLVVLPTFVDNAPNTMLEAMGFGRPVIGTYGTSMDEFIKDGVSGFLVNAGDSAALAEKICKAWDDPNLSDIGNSARKVVSNLTPENILPQLITFYQDILTAKPQVL